MIWRWRSVPFQLFFCSSGREKMAVWHQGRQGSMSNLFTQTPGHARPDVKLYGSTKPFLLKKTENCDVLSPWSKENFFFILSDEKVKGRRRKGDTGEMFVVGFVAYREVLAIIPSLNTVFMVKWAGKVEWALVLPPQLIKTQQPCNVESGNTKSPT